MTGRCENCAVANRKYSMSLKLCKRNVAQMMALATPGRGRDAIISCVYEWLRS